MRSELNLSEPIPRGYEEHLRLTHREMVTFVQAQLKQLRNPLILFYWLINVLILVALLPFAYYFPVTFGLAISRIGLGFAAFVILIPVHELIHGLAYRICGAKKVSYHALPRKLMFYALADRFVVGYRCFIGLAFAPFVCITAGILVLLVILPADWSWFCWGLLFIHTSGCAGDFALAAYFYENRKRSPLTYDLKDEGLTIFLLRSQKEAVSG